LTNPIASATSSETITPTHMVTAALVAAMLCYQLSLNMWVGVIVSLLVALAIGFVNGYLVVRTGIPSFLITLSTFFMLRGINLGATKALTGTGATANVSQLDGFTSAKAVFASDIPLGFITVKITVLWWLVFVAIGTWILLRTRFGNWIFAVGGNAVAARMVGVPVRRVKILLFMNTALAAWLVAMIEVTTARSADVLRGEQREFYAIIAAVIGGVLLTGGYGTVIGAVLGALIYGMVRQGVVFAGIDADWVAAVLGAMLLAAVLVNRYVRQRAMGGRE
jgi:simple sugar transport system permease protein